MQAAAKSHAQTLPRGLILPRVNAHGYLLARCRVTDLPVLRFTTAAGAAVEVRLSWELLRSIRDDAHTPICNL